MFFQIIFTKQTNITTIWWKHTAYHFSLWPFSRLNLPNGIVSLPFNFTYPIVSYWTFPIIHLWKSDSQTNFRLYILLYRLPLKIGQIPDSDRLVVLVMRDWRNRIPLILQAGQDGCPEYAQEVRRNILSFMDEVVLQYKRVSAKIYSCEINWYLVEKV